MLKINLFDPNVLFLEAEGNQKLGVVPLVGTGTLTASTTNLYIPKNLVIATTSDTYVYPLSEYRDFPFYVPITGPNILSILPATITSSVSVKIRRSTGVEHSASWDGSIATFTTGTVTVERLATETRVTCQLTEPSGVLVELSCQLDSIYGGIQYSAYLLPGYSAIQAYREDSGGILKPVNPLQASWILQKPTHIISSSVSGSNYTIVTDGANKGWLVGEHSSLSHQHLILNASTSNGSFRFTNQISATLNTNSLIRVLADTIKSSYSSTVTRAGIFQGEEFFGTGNLKVSAQMHQDNQYPLMFFGSTVNNYVGGSFSGLPATSSKITTYPGTYAGFYLDSWDTASQPVRTITAEIDDTKPFSTEATGPTVKIILPKASGLQALTGGLITSAEYSAILSSLSNKVEGLTSSVGVVAAAPTVAKVGTEIQMAFPLASNVNTLLGGLLSNAEYVAILSSIASKVATITTSITNTVTKPTLTRVNGDVELKIPLASNGGTEGGLITSSEYNAIWDTIGAPKATPSWQASVAYVLGNKVMYRGIMWECISSHFSANFDLELDNWNPLTGSVFTQANTLTLGTFVNITGGTITKARADSKLTLSEPAAMVLAVNATRIVVVHGSLEVRYTHGYTVGTTYYLSQSVAGTAVSAKPTTGYVNPLFKVISAERLLLLGLSAWEE